MKRSHGLTVLLGLTLFGLIACATIGKDFDRTHVNDIKKGVHDKAQVKSWFGAPYQVTTASSDASGCTETWTYQYAHATHGGRKVTSAALVVTFDKNSKVCTSAYSETNQ